VAQILIKAGKDQSIDWTVDRFLYTCYIKDAECLFCCIWILFSSGRSNNWIDGSWLLNFFLFLT
jgi:hypothetical protein